MMRSQGSNTARPAAPAPSPPHDDVAVRRWWGFGGLAAVWWAATTFGVLDLPNSAVVVLGLLVALCAAAAAGRCWARS